MESLFNGDVSKVCWVHLSPSCLPPSGTVLITPWLNTHQASDSNPGAGWSVLGYSFWPLCRNSGSFVHLTLPVSLGRDTKSHQSLLSGVDAEAIKRIAGTITHVTIPIGLFLKITPEQLHLLLDVYKATLGRHFSILCYIL